MYGGKVFGNTATTSEGKGGAIFISSGAIARIFGGEISGNGANYTEGDNVVSNEDVGGIYVQGAKKLNTATGIEEAVESNSLYISNSAKILDRVL